MTHWASFERASWWMEVPQALDGCLALQFPGHRVTLIQHLDFFHTLNKQELSGTTKINKCFVHVLAVSRSIINKTLPIVGKLERWPQPQCPATAGAQVQTFLYLSNNSEIHAQVIPRYVCFGRCQ